ncbi:unnamed protein product (macronuclear) [Paramecium tetraurelia]|uniref:Uncharacterized protein n=1 Tax=Paramecium tetraurelia TaxID=5888 RepID=A0EHM4_PARTE|nr:uncharacterized protein GSPATT00027141001 [Paramecium tetraurelia]CAK94815.1 unnamed protein product [Paramecium tetraurelia]|eukprot:XP_001462188.1 hypothetical protein (macronuclear) [Paramecium tetraurelia strain d4-2]
MLNINTQGEKLKQSANYIKTLQKEVSEFKEKINNLEFELSTLKFLEQYIQYEIPKLDEINEDKEREKQETQSKLNKLLKEIQDLKDSNSDLQSQLKAKDQQKQEIIEKLKSELSKKQQDFEKCQAELEAKNKLFDEMKKKEEENFAIIQEGSATNSPTNEKKMHDIQKYQIENQRLKNEYQQLKKEYDNLTNIFNDLVKERHKQDEDNQQSVRDWKTKYDQIAKLRDSDKESFQSQLEDKTKVIGNLQQKLYQIQKETSTKDTQTHEQTGQKDSIVSFQYDEEQIDVLDKTLEIISNSSIQQIITLCQTQGQQNDLLRELKRIIEETISIVHQKLATSLPSMIKTCCEVKDSSSIQLIL